MEHYAFETQATIYFASMSTWEYPLVIRTSLGRHDLHFGSNIQILSGSAFLLVSGTVTAGQGAIVKRQLSGRPRYARTPLPRPLGLATSGSYGA